MSTETFGEKMLKQRILFKKFQDEMNKRFSFLSSLNGSTINVQYESGELQCIQVASSNFVMVEAVTKPGNKRPMLFLNVVGTHTAAYCLDGNGLKKGQLESLYYAHSDVTLQHEWRMRLSTGQILPVRITQVST